MPLTYFDFMISILLVICNHVHDKTFDHVNIGKVFLKINLLVTYLFLYLFADDVILLTKLVPNFDFK